MRAGLRSAIEFKQGDDVHPVMLSWLLDWEC